MVYWIEMFFAQVGTRFLFIMEEFLPFHPQKKFAEDLEEYNSPETEKEMKFLMIDSQTSERINTVSFALYYNVLKCFKATRLWNACYEKKSFHFSASARKFANLHRREIRVNISQNWMPYTRWWIKSLTWRKVPLLYCNKACRKSQTSL